jgi:hypothetical protein
MSENKYQPLTPDQRDRAVLDSREKPYFAEFEAIVLAAERLAMMAECGEHNHSHEELEEAAEELLGAIHDCVPATAISILDLDDIMTMPEHLEDHFNKDKIQ